MSLIPLSEIIPIAERGHYRKAFREMWLTADALLDILVKEHKDVMFEYDLMKRKGLVFEHIDRLEDVINLLKELREYDWCQHECGNTGINAGYRLSGLKMSLMIQSIIDMKNKADSALKTASSRQSEPQTFSLESTLTPGHVVPTSM